MKKKITAIILIIILCFQFSFTILATEDQVDNNQENTTSEENQTENSEVKSLTLEEQKKILEDQLGEANVKLDYVKGEISNTVYQIQQLEDKIAAYERDVQTITYQYTELNQRVEEVSLKLQKVEESYTKNDKYLKERLVALYEAGDTSFLDVLLNSASLSQFISNYYIIQEITKHDTEILDTIEKEKNEIAKQKAQLDSDKAEMKLIKSKKEQQAVLLENTKIIQENYRNNLTDSENSLNEEINEYKRQQRLIENLIANAIADSTYDLSYSGGIMIWPTLTTTHITSPFGNRLHPIQGINKNHDGIDIGGGYAGAPIYASSDGVVIYSAWMGGYGYAIMIDHGSGITTLYGHSQKLLVEKGATVKKGDLIMEMGSTGNSTGPHLHFEVREKGVPVDPAKYLSDNYQR